MICRLNELNDKINDFVNYVVKEACENTSSGNYIIQAREVCEACGMEYNDYLKYRDFIEDELHSREELLDFIIDNNEVDVNCALDYCPNYEWVQGDEYIFGSYEKFEKREILPVSQPFSLTEQAEAAERRAILLHNAILLLSDKTFEDYDNVQEWNEMIYEELGTTKEELNSMDIFIFTGDESVNKPEIIGTLTYHYNNEVVEYSDKTNLLVGYKDAINVYGINGVSAKVLSDDDVLKYQIDVLKYNEFGEDIPSFEEWEKKAEGISKDLYIGKWRVHLVPVGGRYGLDNQLINDSEKTFIEFHDISQDKTKFPNGQFTGGRYYVETILEGREGHSNAGLNIDVSIPAWYVSPVEMSQVYGWLDKQELSYNDIPKNQLKIEDLDLSVYTWRQLKNAGINTVAELAFKTEIEIKNIKNIGIKSYKEIVQKMTALGFEFPCKEVKISLNDKILASKKRQGKKNNVEKNDSIDKDQHFY